MPAVVSVTVLGRPYDIGCDEGQEDTVRQRAAEVDRRALDVQKAIGHVTDTRLLVLVALLLADELHEARNQVDRARNDDDPLDQALASGIEALAKRLDTIAERLDHA